jgi:outer membrane lipoprotein
MNRHHTPGFILVVLSLLQLGACASGPTFDTSQVDRSLTPTAAGTQPQSATGRQVLWGGVILGVTNLVHSTLVEMQAYPLGYQEKPQTDEAPQGRFLLEQSGFLEPAVYTDGRLLTATGRITRIDTGKAGETQQSFPVIEAQQLHLWPVDSFREDTGLRFGGEIGVGYGF